MRSTPSRANGALLALALAAVGCGGGGFQAARIDEQGQASVCAAGSVVQGLDVSVYQGSVDWPTVKAQGIGFGIARISDGTTLDTTFDANWAGMLDAGLVRGAYQFFEPGQDPTSQANVVAAAVGALAVGDLPVVADVEVSGGQTPQTLVANLQTWLDAVQASTGRKPLVYTSPGLWSSLTGSSSAFGGYPLWVANWGVSCPSLPSGWSGWNLWQYSDQGHVTGVPATVDLDEFNGSLAQLQGFAGAAPQWGAAWVSQSWPLATSAFQMTVNQRLPATLTLQNTGSQSWDANTVLATTQPRDRASPFAASDWSAPNVLSAVSGSVASGQSYAFGFTFQAPNAPGLYDEFYGVEELGVTWFSDPAEGGPADNVIEARIQVVEAQYHGALVSQTLPSAAESALAMNVGDTVSGTITVQNVGTSTWTAGVVKLAPTPRDSASPLAAASWLSSTRVASPAQDVAPGDSFAFPVELTASAPGEYVQTFSLIAEGITWFADAPLGGGPQDDGLSVHVIVSAPPDAGVLDAGSELDAGVVDAGSELDAGSPDAGSELDAGASLDAGPPDAGPLDAGPPDAGPPPAPAAPVLDAVAVSGFAATFSGAAPPATTVTVYEAGQPLCSAPSNGRFACIPRFALRPGPHTVQAQSVDGRGEASPLSAPQSFTIAAPPLETVARAGGCGTASGTDVLAWALAALALCRRRRPHRLAV